MHRRISRRSIVKGSLVAGALVPAFSLLARAASMTPLDANDPMAKALGFVADASKVDGKANPTFKTSQKCANCVQFIGKAGDATGGCNIFAGHSVPAGGWCKSWVVKPA